MDEQQKLVSWILKVSVTCLASMIVVMVFALVIALFVPNEMVDNKDIFPIIGPAFNTVIGAFVGLLGGLSLNSDSKKEEKKPEEPTLGDPSPADLVPEPTPEVAPLVVAAALQLLLQQMMTKITLLEVSYEFSGITKKDWSYS
jgi:hypothetical protein